jgi:hypothetical protein
MKESVHNFFKSFNIFTQAEIGNFMDLSTITLLNKSDYFIKESEVSKQVAFVLSGVLRSYLYIQ